MKFEFEKVLAKHNITEEELSTPLKKKVQFIRGVVDGIQVEEARLTTESMSVAKKTELTKKIEDGKNAIPVLDVELVKALNKWIPNRAVYAEAGKRLAAQRGAKATSVAIAPAAATTVVPVPEPAKPVATTTTTKTTTKAIVTPEPEKKAGITAWGWVGIGLAAILAAAGIKIALNARNNA
jgi:hypothetical protein